MAITRWQPTSKRLSTLDDVFDEVVGQAGLPTNGARRRWPATGRTRTGR